MERNSQQVTYDNQLGKIKYSQEFLLKTIQLTYLTKNRIKQQHEKTVRASIHP